MTITPKNFKYLVITFATVGVFALPLWPWCHWGYFPSILMTTLIIALFLLRHLASI
jgi:hypothetical protein